MKKAIIIGSNSFSALHYVKFLLNKKIKVFGISRSGLPGNTFSFINKNTKNFSFYRLDLNKNLKNIIKIINQKRPDYIINFASQSMVAESWDKPYDWFLTNSYSIPNLYYEISKLQFKTRLVHISTPEVYGNTLKKINEDFSFNPNTPYAASRTTADYYLSILSKNSAIDFVATRSANVYGEYQSLYRIIPKTIFCILNKEKLFLHGNGKSKRSFIHIEDVCSATYLLMISKKLNKNRFYNISTDQLISIKDLVEKICHILGYNVNLLVKNSSERIGKDFIYHLDSSKLKKLGWRSNISLADGIIKTLNWVKKNFKNFKSSDLKYIHRS